MCGCTLLKAQLAAKTEESCLETELPLSIRCPCLRSLRSVIFLGNFTESQRASAAELGQEAVFEKDFYKPRGFFVVVVFVVFLGSVSLFLIRDCCVGVCWKRNKPVCSTLTATQ